MKSFITIAPLLALFASSATALGINCRGSSNCGGTLCSLSQLQSQISQLPDANTYGPGEHISCCGDPSVGSGLCAFTQNTSDRITGARVKQLMDGLVQHGCKKCGSNPFQNNDVSQGELTVNYVTQR